MNTFSVKFKAGSLDLSAIVTVSDRHQKFKVEMITGEPDPILLKRSATGQWTIENPGQRALSAEQFLELETVIEQHLTTLYSAKKILVLTDFSAPSFNAAIYAAKLSHQLNASALLLYHSYEYLPVVTTNFTPVSPEMVYSEKESHQKMEELKERLQILVPKDMTIETLANARSLVSAVDTIAEQQQTGLVVMGIAGKNALEKALVGSNTITIAKECKLPLLIVPDQAEYKPLKSVILSCDLRNVSKTLPVYPINTLIDTLKARLSILYVNKISNPAPPEAKDELIALHQIWNEKQVKYQYTDHENIEESILDFADEHAADLLIAVPKEYSFLERIFHRSLTKNLVYRTHLPLVIFKENI